MKKGIKITAAAALAVSALTPVAALAAETTLAPGYYSDTFTPVSEFAKMKPSEKKAFLKANLGKANFIFIDGENNVYDFLGSNGEKILNHTSEAELKKYATTVAAYETANKVEISSSGIAKEQEAAGELKVESVSAINASEIVVNFNKAVDSKTALDGANYDIKINNVPATIETISATGKDSIVLSKDGKSVTIRLIAADAFQAGDKYVIQTNDAIKSADGKVATKYVSAEKVFAESAAPKLLSVKPGSNLLTLEFDRPVVNSTPLVKVDGYDIDGVATSPTTLTGSDVAGNYKYTVSVTDPVAQATIFEKGTHEVIIYDVEDTADAYQAKASVLTGSYTITDEVTIPVVEEVIAVNANRFFLQTNVAVDLSTAKLKVEKGNHEFLLQDNELVIDTVAGNETVVDATVGTYKTKPGVWVVVTDDVDANDENPLYKGTETSATLKVTLENFKDAATNSLLGQKAVKTVTLNKNNSKPVVDSTKVNGTNLEVAFTEELTDANANTTGLEVVVRNKDGVIVSTATSGTIIADANGDDKVVEIALGAAYKQADEPYSVEFKAGELKYTEDNSSISGYLVNTVKNDKINTVVKSTSTNFLYTELTLTDVAGGSISSAGDVKVSTGVNGKDTIEIFYGREMTDSARTVANYTLDGKALPAGTTVDFVDDKDKVRIVLPEGSLKASTSYKLAVSTNVKTAEGSTIVGSLQTKAQTEVVISLDDNVAPELKSATYLRADEEVKTTTSTTYVELTFSEVVTATDAANTYDDLKVVVAGSTIDVVGIIENKDANGVNVTDNKLIAVLDTAVNVAQAATFTVVAEDAQKGNKTTYIVDTAGNKAKAGSEAKTSGSKYSTQYAQVVASNQAAADLATAQGYVASATANGVINGSNFDVTLSSANGVTWTKALATVSGTVSESRPTYGSADGSVTYVASSTVNGQTATANKVVSIPAETLNIGVSGTATAAYDLTVVATGSLDISTESITGLEDNNGNAITATIGDFTATAETIAHGDVTVTGGTDDDNETVTVTADGKITLANAAAGDTFVFDITLTDAAGAAVTVTVTVTVSAS